MTKLIMQKLFLATVMLLVNCVISSKSYAVTTNYPCNQSQGVGSPFYNFNKIIIYYLTMPREADQRKSDFPPELRSLKFRKIVEENVAQNLEKCLPSHVKMHDVIITTDKRIKEIFEEGNLTFIIRLSWPYKVSDRSDLTFATLQTQIFRSDLSTVNKFVVLGRAKSFSFFPTMKTEDSLANQLKYSLSLAFKPIITGSGIPNSPDGILPWAP